MNKIQYNVISSGSSGNAIIVENILVLDIGVSYSKIKQCLKDIKLIFISHCHSDHLKATTVKKIAFEYPNIKFLVGTRDLVEKLLSLNVQKKNIIALPYNKWYDLGMCKVCLLPLFHDVPNTGLKLELENKKILYVVDTNKIDHIDAKNYDLYLVENNYQEEMINKHRKEYLQKGESTIYLDRVVKTHLSSEKVNSFLIENMGDNSCFEYIHKSQFNIDEEKL